MQNRQSKLAFSFVNILEVTESYSFVGLFSYIVLMFI